MYGPCLSSIGGGQPLSSPTRRRLGRPLPYQLPDAAQAAQKADCSFTPEGLSGIAPPFDGICLTFRCVPVYYYLVCRGSKPTRLACLIHAASIHPELGSNSDYKSEVLISLPRLVERNKRKVSPKQFSPITISCLLLFACLARRTFLDRCDQFFFFDV